ncbi:MAPEG family protein [Pleionea sediminis]|uniref:MAPEG family protein n=1 Tax=Pleionea sediminis TaxID=2569479 RepID=UPI001185F19E|nr:MAPEG family protein [Pleionea sediminis]
MTFLIWTVFFSIIMTVITKLPVAIAMKRQFGHYDNRDPRTQERQLSGFGRRAMGAHENSFEALSIFTAGAAFAGIVNPAAEIIPILCLSFIVSRLLYVVFYYYDFDKFRSIAWSIGFFASIGLLFTGL